MNTRTPATNISSLLLGQLDCREQSDLPAAAARFILGHAHESSPTSIGGYREVDELMNEATRRFSVDVVPVRADEASRLGRLYVKRGGFGLRIVRDVHQMTYRFVKAHELAHILGYDRSGREPRRIFPNSALEERLCDSIARHILMPEQSLGSRLDALIRKCEPLAVEEIELISREYLVTPWQVVRSAVERYGEGRVVAIAWKEVEIDCEEPEVAGSEPGSTIKVLRIGESVSPVGLYIPRDDRCFLGSGTNQIPWTARACEKAVVGHEMFEIGSLRGKLESLGFYSSSPRPCVIQIVFLDSAHTSKISHWRSAHINGSP